MASKAESLRPIVKLRSSAGTGYTYGTRKNRRSSPERDGAAPLTRIEIVGVGEGSAATPGDAVHAEEPRP